MEYLTVPESGSSREQIARAAQAVRDGGLVAFPTETVYGLGCSAFDERAVRRVFAAKRRPLDNPLIVHVSRDWPMPELTDGQSRRVVHDLARGFWPGPLTIVVPGGAEFAPSVRGGRSTVAIRCPDHPVALALLDAAGVPIAAPSANSFGYISPTSARHVAEDLGDLCDLILDAGTTRYGLESTVVEVQEGELTILRHGAVPLERLRSSAAAASVPVWDGTLNAPGPRRSPGLHRRHYSPRVASVAVAPGVDLRQLPAEGSPPDETIRYVGYDGRQGMVPAAWCRRSLGPILDLGIVAHDLYDNLRRFDPPDQRGLLMLELTGEPGLGRAIDDRLTRAASGVTLTSGEDVQQFLAQLNPNRAEP